MKTITDRADGFAVVVRFGPQSGQVRAWVTTPDGERYVLQGTTPAAAIAAANAFIDDIKRRAA